MRIFGVILIMFSVIEFGIGATAHGYLSSPKIYLGSWWTGLAALLNKTRGVVILMITMGAIANAVAVAGVVIDAMAAAEFSNLTICGRDRYSTYYSSGYYYYSGDGSTSLLNARCSGVEDDHCFCISTATNYCLKYALNTNSKYDCAALMTTLPKFLKTSAALCSVLASCSLVLVSIGLSIICSSPSIAKPVTKDPTDLVANYLVGVNSNDKAF
jgi:hypothetical protein